MVHRMFISSIGSWRWVNFKNLSYFQSFYLSFYKSVCAIMLYDLLNIPRPEKFLQILSMKKDVERFLYSNVTRLLQELRRHFSAFDLTDNYWSTYLRFDLMILRSAMNCATDILRIFRKKIQFSSEMCTFILYCTGIGPMLSLRPIQGAIINVMGWNGR